MGILTFFQKIESVTRMHLQKNRFFCSSIRYLKIEGMFTFSFLLIFLFRCSYTFALEPEHFRFRHLTSADGLSVNNVRGVVQDSRGFIWFGTWAGLNRYDGYKFKTYKPRSGDSNSLSDNVVSAILEDKNGILWIGTAGGGLNRFDPDLETFKHYTYNPENLQSLSNDIVVTITEGNNGILLIGTWGGGLNRFNPKTERFTHYLHSPHDISSLSGDYVTAIHKNPSGGYWVMTRYSGLNLFNPENDTFKRFSLLDIKEGSSWGQNIFHEDSDSTIWFVSRNALYRLDPETQRFQRYTIETDEIKIKGVHRDNAGNLWVFGLGRKSSLYRFDESSKQFIPFPFSNEFLAMHSDGSGLVWLVANTFGIMNFDPYPKKFFHISLDDRGKHVLPEKSIQTLMEDSLGYLWMNTYKGVYRWDKETGIITQTKGSHGELTVPTERWHILEDPAGDIWITSSDHGIDRLNPKTGRIRNYRYRSGDKKSLSNDYSLAVFADRNGQIWIGTDSGLNLYNHATDRFERYFPDPDKTDSPNNNIFTIFEDKKGLLWTGSWYGGLRSFDKKSRRFIKTFQHDPKNPVSLGSNVVNVIVQDQKEKLWIGGSNGLSLYDPVNERFENFREEDGLCNNTIVGILEDHLGNLWISTVGGISRFNPKTRTFRNYDVSDGLQADQFNSKSFAKGSKGEFYFGGINGFNYFFPDKVKDNPFIPPVLITDFRLFNQPVPIGKNSILKQGIWSTDHITLTHGQNIFSLEFAAISNRAPEKNRYRYRLVGLEKKWNEVSSKRRYVSYTNLSPGNYVFRLHGSNNDGMWNKQGATLNITILPAWWQTLWFKIVCFFFVILVILSIYFMKLSIYKKNRDLLVNQVDIRTKELATANKQLEFSKNIAENANKAKSEFLSNMSHELRAPLNGILGYAQILLKDSNLTVKQKTNLEIIHKSGCHLLNLINDILDLSKIVSKKSEIKSKQFNLPFLLQDIINITKVKGLEKGIDILYDERTPIPQIVKGDERKLRQVLLNLMDNAIKYTDFGSVILRVSSAELKVSREEESDADMPGSGYKRDRVVFEIEDTGIGIPKENIGDIFEPFTQVKIGSVTKVGTGLGLSISQGLVKLMKGKLSVKSELNKGSIFTLVLKLPVVEGKIVISNWHLRNISGYKGKRKSILIVDDNIETLSMIVSMLEPYGFKVLTTQSGDKALKIVSTVRLDLILLDFMIPEMSGDEILGKLRANEELGHLKVIGMSAAIADKDRVAPFAEACDDFIAKPIDYKELLVKVKKQLQLDWILKKASTEEVTKKAMVSFREMPERMKYPPRLVLDEISQKALLGNFASLERILERLEAESSNYIKFCSKMKEFVRNYDHEAIIQFIFK